MKHFSKLAAVALITFGCGGAADSPPDETGVTGDPGNSTSSTDGSSITRPVITDFTTGDTLDPNTPDYGTTTSDGVGNTGGGTSDGPGTGGTGTSDGPGTGGGTTTDGPGTGGTTTDGSGGTGGTTSDGPGTGGTTSDGVGGTGNTDDDSGGTGGTTSDGVGGTGGTTDDGSGGTGNTDDGVGGTGLTYDAPPPPPPAPPPPPGVGGTTSDGSGGTSGTDDGSGGTGLTYDAPPPPPPVPPPPLTGTGGTDDGSGGTGGTDDQTGGTSGTDDQTGGTGGTYTPPSEDCPWVCIPPVYEEVNVIVLTDAWLENCDVEGQLYVGNDATFPSYSVGTRMTPPDASRYDLVVGNDLVYNNGSVPNGAVAYGGTLSRSNSAYAMDWVQATPVDFDQLTNDMLYWSDSLAAQPSTGTTTIQYGAVRFEGTDPALNIFEIDAADMANINGMTISVPAGATALINISGTDVVMQNYGIFFEDGADKQYTMFNMYEAENITWSGIGINGSVLAPRADLDFTSGNIDGQLVVDNYIVQGRVSGEGHPYYFQGCPWVCL